MLSMLMVDDGEALGTRRALPERSEDEAGPKDTCLKE